MLGLKAFTTTSICICGDNLEEPVLSLDHEGPRIKLRSSISHKPSSSSSCFPPVGSGNGLRCPCRAFPNRAPFSLLQTWKNFMKAKHASRGTEEDKAAMKSSSPTQITVNSRPALMGYMIKPRSKQGKRREMAEV